MCDHLYTCMYVYVCVHFNGVYVLLSLCKCHLYVYIYICIHVIGAMVYNLYMYISSITMCMCYICAMMYMYYVVSIQLFSCSM